MQAILDAVTAGRLPARPAVVISNNAKSMALERARREGVPAYHLCVTRKRDEGQLDRDIVATLEQHEADIVVLAGYMKKIGPRVLDAYRNRIVNIHPALLPKFGGKGMYGRRVHEAVLEAGERETGVTIHLVDEHYDHGRILSQARLPVRPDDTPDTLAERVLALEHTLYPETLRRIATGEIRLDG